MGRDRSLDEFFGGESNASAASNADSDGDEAEESGAAVEADGSDAETGTVNPDSEPEPTVDDASAATPDPEHTATDPDREGGESEPADGERSETHSDDVEPASVTYRWEPDGARCAECGATVEQLWSGEAGQVCVECKEW
jgi:hypothetical protein